MRLGKPRSRVGTVISIWWWWRSIEREQTAEEPEVFRFFPVFGTVVRAVAAYGEMLSDNVFIGDKL
jgi:hypothetical protein